MLEEKIRLKKAFPAYLAEDIDLISKEKSLNQPRNYFLEKTVDVFVNNEEIEIPKRHNLTEIYKADFTSTQQNIVDCYYTRHCDGFIREKHLKKVIIHNQEWTVPYVIQLLGEYVIEILEVIYNNLEKLDVILYKKFIRDNVKSYDLTKQRVASYWSCYYRWKYKYKQDYVGFKILDFIDTKVIK